MTYQPTEASLRFKERKIRNAIKVVDLALSLHIKKIEGLEEIQNAFKEGSGKKHILKYYSYTKRI